MISQSLIAAILAISLATVATAQSMQAQGNNNNTISAIITPPTTSGGGPFLPTNVFQDSGQIVVTVMKDGKAPTGPVIVIPPTGNEKNATILTPGENTTKGGNNSNATIVIDPKGNVTEVKNGNVTQIDNSTVVVTQPDRNVTTTQGNVTVIDPPTPPVANNNQTCTCQNQNQTQPAKPQPIAPVVVMPAPGQKVNITTQPSPIVGNTTHVGSSTNTTNTSNNSNKTGISAIVPQNTAPMMGNG